MAKIAPAMTIRSNAASLATVETLWVRVDQRTLAQLMKVRRAGKGKKGKGVEKEEKK